MTGLTAFALPVCGIVPGENDRFVFDEAGLAELADSIRERGLAQPITTRPVFVDGSGKRTLPDKGSWQRWRNEFAADTGLDMQVVDTYTANAWAAWISEQSGEPDDDLRPSKESKARLEIVMGERRFRAMSTILQSATIPGFIRFVGDAAASDLMLAENASRKDLLIIEEAKGYKKRMDRFGYTASVLAEKAGVSPERVKRLVRLLNVDPQYWPLINSDALPIGHADELSRLPLNKQQLVMRVFAKSGGMAFSEFRHVCQSMRETDDQGMLFDLEAMFTQEVERHALAVHGSKAAENAGVPVDVNMPAVKYAAGMSAGEVMHGYIQDLEQNGLHSEAAALGNLFTIMVKYSWIRLPRKQVAV